MSTLTASSFPTISKPPEGDLFESTNHTSISGNPHPGAKPPAESAAEPPGLPVLPAEVVRRLGESEQVGLRIGWARWGEKMALSIRWSRPKDYMISPSGHLRLRGSLLMTLGCLRKKKGAWCVQALKA